MVVLQRLRENKKRKEGGRRGGGGGAQLFLPANLAFEVREEMGGGDLIRSVF